MGMKVLGRFLKGKRLIRRADEPNDVDTAHLDHLRCVRVQPSANWGEHFLC
jgi:hypothetical protein